MSERREMAVTSTHCSAMLGSRELASVGVAGREEPDSCIWHSSSSVMMSNTVSSGDLKSGFAPGPQRQIRREEKHTRSRTGWEGSLGDVRGAAMRDRPPGHTARNHPTTAPLPRCVRNSCRDVAPGRSQKSRVGTTEESGRTTSISLQPFSQGLGEVSHSPWFRRETTYPNLSRKDPNGKAKTLLCCRVLAL